MESVSPSTFEAICALEPRLRSLAEEIERIKPELAHFCANRTWYRDYEDRFNALLGWHAWNPTLRSEVAYNIAFKRLYELMPPCRNCTCL